MKRVGGETFVHMLGQWINVAFVRRFTIEECDGRFFVRIEMDDGKFVDDQNGHPELIKAFWHLHNMLFMDDGDLEDD